jgi:hypothetical protein
MHLRAKAGSIGLTDIIACRQLRRDELGGAMPFDQSICESLLHEAANRQSTREAAGMVSAIALSNAVANWVLRLEFQTPELASAAARAFGGGDVGFATLTGATTEHTIGAFRNMMRYASVSRDPNVIQFFNLFPSPGKLDVLWPSWREALPWFFEVGGILSSFPLLALDPKQPMLPGQLRALRLDQAIPRRHAVRSAVRRNLEGMLRAARRDSSNAVLLQDRAGVAFISLPDFGEGRFLQFRNALV